MPELEISSYGIMDTSLEEVFLKVTERSQTAIEQENEKNDEKELMEMNVSQLPSNNEITAINNETVGNLIDVDSEVNPAEPRGVVTGQNVNERNEALKLRKGSGCYSYYGNDPVDDNLDLLLDDDLLLSQDVNGIGVELLPSEGDGQQLLLHEMPASPAVLHNHQPPASIPGRLFKKKHQRSPSAGHITMARRRKQIASEQSGEKSSPNDDSQIGLNSECKYIMHGDIRVQTHVRSPSDASKKTTKGHFRAPSDISLRTLAAIRGTYQTHRRTGSNVSATGFKHTHQR